MSRDTASDMSSTKLDFSFDIDICMASLTFINGCRYDQPNHDSQKQNQNPKCSFPIKPEALRDGNIHGCKYGGTGLAVGICGIQRGAYGGVGGGCTMRRLSGL
ncbi:hypothetical protein PVK06_009688 [Gossypium arboreum]|uniref:Uncharacterized protein n=1 Tax=Gossypium arboreum TaxID=29729 RepID=A0ABR0QP51_GOSAR|nr:hypothetical protein PVK06_009688 [Gossypium arboreum]